MSLYTVTYDVTHGLTGGHSHSGTATVRAGNEHLVAAELEQWVLDYDLVAQHALSPKVRVTAVTPA